MIRSFADKATEEFFFTGKGAHKQGWSAVANVVARKLDQLQAAVSLDDLKSPPSNRLEALRGDRTGFHSIRVNDQWRVVFKWTCQGPTDVAVMDYH